MLGSVAVGGRDLLAGVRNSAMHQMWGWIPSFFQGESIIHKSLLAVRFEPRVLLVARQPEGHPHTCLLQFHQCRTIASGSCTLTFSLVHRSIVVFREFKSQVEVAVLCRKLHTDVESWVTYTQSSKTEFWIWCNVTRSQEQTSLWLAICVWASGLARSLLHDACTGASDSIRQKDFRLGVWTNPSVQYRKG